MHVVYVPLCNQMIDQPRLKSLHIKVVHVPLERQWSLRLIVIIIMRDLFLRGDICTALHSNALIRITAYQSGTCTTLESVKLKESYFGQVATTLHSSD